MTLSKIAYIFAFISYISPIACMELTTDMIDQKSIQKINQKNEKKFKEFFINTSELHTQKALNIASCQLGYVMRGLENNQNKQNTHTTSLLLLASKNAHKAKELKELYQTKPDCTKAFYKNLCKIDRLHRIIELLKK